MTDPRFETERDGEPFRILFVCTGNTCRSPMAEALARRSLERRGWGAVEVRSAGVGAFPGLPASPGAVRACAQRGLDLSRHESRPLLPEDVEAADLILTMSPHHLHVVESLGGGGKGEVITVFAAGQEGRAAEAEGVQDPVGGDDAVYEEACGRLEVLVEEALSRLEPVIRP